MRIKNPSSLISQPKILLYCFVVGFFIWLFNELNNRSNATMLYPIDFKYENKEEFIVVSSPPKFIEISINGTGWNLLRNLLKMNIRSAEYNINKPSQTKFVLSSSLIPNISESLENVDLNYVVTDSIFFSIEQKKSKELTIKVDTLQFSFKENYERISDVNISHEEITVEGPESIISSMPDEYNINIDKVDISADYDKDIKIDGLNKLLDVTPEKINLNFKVAEFVIQEIQLNAYYDEDNVSLDTSVLVLFKVKKGAELTDSLYVNFKNESGILTPEIITTEKIEILNISPNSFILDK
tara:strand:+ start:1104 stop:1997 length:894 start_codon:yes stop_codon:yes gene_type:complete